ncbi:protein phosphatase 1 regulatory subunit 12A-like [Dendronephthya gigantea]|uniref:protein phosphatase 1 regulatory subunit 12A-like n=1 Tax=Dendronephthya gigantea TaxID=151771 RepID=UPI00106BC7AC|nr:protein phosphatase 1 regulatory subunit 12A-like [Dendronephthya gigantea]
MLQGILRTYPVGETHTQNVVGEKKYKQSPSLKSVEKTPNVNTTLRVKMKVVRKTRSPISNGGVEANESARDSPTGVAAPYDHEIDDKQSSLLKVPSDERLRRRLSDSLELEKQQPPTPRVRRRSVSFDPLTVFKTAILENDVETVKSVLVSGKVNANSCVDGVFAVILAAKEGSAECLEALLDNGADIDICDKRGFTPLELAVQGGYFDCAQVLIAAGANANSIRDGYFDETIESGRHSTGRSRSRTF